MNSLSEYAADLRARHIPGRPLVLANIWDAASARAVAAAGHPVIATSSVAVAAALGFADGEQMPADEAFAAVRRIAGAVELPVTADLEAGYGLAPAEFVDRLLNAGAVGCNLEDSDHRGGRPLLDAERQAEYIAAVREAGRGAGVDLVINARVDVHIRKAVPPDQRLAETVRRGRAYLNAGAACVYPIGVTQATEVSSLVDEMGGPVNVWLRPDGPRLDALSRLGVARVSLAAAMHRQAMARVTELATALAPGTS